MAAPAICLSQGATSLAANQVPSVSGRGSGNTGPDKIQLQPRLALRGRSEIRLTCQSQPLHGFLPAITRKQEFRNRQSLSRRRCCRASEGGAGVADEQDRENVDLPPVPAGQMMVPYMKKGYGAYGGGATLEKSKLSLSSSQTKTSPQMEMGGGGTNNGNRNANGGGDGGDDGGDDDDYSGAGDEDDGDDGNRFLRRVGIIELFDRASIEAVLQEWFRTMADLPSGLRRAMEMGLMSSAQVVKFLSMNARPTVARAMARMAPQSVSRAFIGRMLADPAFIQKAVLEQAITIGTATYWEVQTRGDRLRQEWDLALANVLTLAACNAAMVWTLSPSRSYGTTARFDWQNLLQKLPNHVFDKSYPMREFNLVSRVSSFFYKAAELSLVGTVVGSAGGAVSNALLTLKRQRNPDFKPAVSVPSIPNSAFAYGAFLGLSGNLRYQLLNGADRAMLQHLDSLNLALFGTSALRFLNNKLGEPSRLVWLGIDAELTARQESGATAFRRQTATQAKKSLPEDIKAFFQDFSFKKFSLPTKDSLPFIRKSGGDASQPKKVRRKVKRKVSMAH